MCYTTTRIQYSNTARRELDDTKERIEENYPTSKQRRKELRHNDIISQIIQKSKLSLSLSLRANLKSKNLHGFTIVELLIVIVVIGILAAISAVAYAGITNGANDAAVQQNLRDAMNKLRVYEAAKGVTPVPNSSSDSELTVAMEGFSVSRGAYATGNNFIYCRDSTSGVYGIGARSKSGRSFAYSSTGGLQKLNSALPFSGGGDTGACNMILGMPTAWTWGYTGGWTEWAS